MYITDWKGRDRGKQTARKKYSKVRGAHLRHLGGFLRLSHAVYNTDDDFRRLRDAILDLRG